MPPSAYSSLTDTCVPFHLLNFPHKLTHIMGNNKGTGKFVPLL